VKKISVIIVKRTIKIEWVGEKNCTTNIELHLGQVIIIILQMSIIEELYDDIKKKNDIHKTSVLCLRTKQIDFKIKEFRVMNSTLYKNEGLNLTMIVKKG
jgi:hypothetical protein